MSFFKAENYAQIPMEYKAKADFIFVEEAVAYGKYPTKKFRCVKQPALETPDRSLGAEGVAEYEKYLKARVAPGSVVAVGPTVNAEEPTNVIVTDDGKDFYKFATGAEGAIHFTVSTVASGPLGYKFTLMPQPVVYENEELAIIKDVDLAASFASGILTVKLGREDSVPAKAEVGDDNKMEVEFKEHGEFWNDWEVIVESDNGVVQPLAVVRDGTGKTLTITLATGEVADDNAEAEFTQNDAVVKAEVAGIAGNDYTLAVNADTDELRSLSASLTGENDEDILVLLAVEGDGQASVSIGAGDDGVVTTQVIAPGSDGNAYTIEVDNSLDELRSLSAEFLGFIDEDILVKLSTKPDQQAQAIIETSTPGGGDTPAIIVNATALGEFDGTAGNGVEVVFIDEGEEGTVIATYDGGTNRIIVNFRNKVDETAANIGSLINGLTGFDGDQASGGNFTAASDVGVTTGTLAGGTNQLDDDENTAALVAVAVNNLAGVASAHSGTGADPITESVATTNFTGGTNQLNNSANTGTLVAGAIEGVEGVTGSVSGTAGGTIDTAVEPIALTGGTNSLDASANTRTLVKTAIEELEDWDVEVGAHGAVAFTSTDDGTYEFAAGDDGGDLDDTKNTMTLVRDAVHALEAFTSSAVTGSGATVLDADNYVEEALFNTELIDEDDNVRGSVNRTTGLLTVDFGAVTVLEPYVTSKYLKYGHASINNPTNIALAHSEYSTVYVDLRGEGKIYHAAHPFSR